MNIPKSFIPEITRDPTLFELVDWGTDIELTSLHDMYVVKGHELVLTKMREYGVRIASLPELVLARINNFGVDKFIPEHWRYHFQRDRTVWDHWFTANSEIDTGSDHEGRFTREGGLVNIIVHGGGILTPDIFGEIRTSKLTKQDPVAVEIDQETITKLLAEEHPDGGHIPVYGYDDFCDVSADSRFLVDNPRFAVVLPFETFDRYPSQDYQVSQAYHHPLMVVYAGGVEQAAKYLDRFKEREGEDTFALRHPFAFPIRPIKGFDKSIPQGRYLSLGQIYYQGIDATIGVDYSGNFLLVRPNRTLLHPGLAELQFVS
ncbi:MAG: hypothetical protein QGH47_00480 [Candidatus Woesearchaeota archaeon]|jgi:hypothetical protein|nr:hypothetical protein [Candidatus Woesearchaeota archaeon]